MPGAPKPPSRSGREVLGGELVGWVAGPAAVAVEREAVHDQGVGEEVEVLASWPTEWARRSQRVSSRARLMRLGVVAAAVEPLEVGVARRDRPDVLGAVELPLRVFVVAVEPDGDRAAAEVVGELVVVVPAVLRSCRPCGGCGSAAAA